MYERFTDRARRVVVLAQEEARLMNHNYIGTEHILLALVREEDGVAARALVSFDLTLEKLREQVVKLVDRGDKAPVGHIPFTHRAKKILELSLREALQLGQNYIGTEHILLGLLREGLGMGCQTLVDREIELEAVREKVLELLHQSVADRALAEKLRREQLKLAADIAALKADNCRKMMTVKFPAKTAKFMHDRWRNFTEVGLKCGPIEWIISDIHNDEHRITLGMAARALAWIKQIEPLLNRADRRYSQLKCVHRRLQVAYDAAIARHTADLQKAFDRAHT